MVSAVPLAVQLQKLYVVDSESEQTDTADSTGLSRLIEKGSNRWLSVAEVNELLCKASPDAAQPAPLSVSSLPPTSCPKGPRLVTDSLVVHELFGMHPLSEVCLHAHEPPVPEHDFLLMV